jgi:DNA uptake protein ComE-like DNA-binding protein
MKLVTAAASACALALLSGCQTAQQAQREALEAAVQDRIAQAVQACHAQRFPTAVARAQCRNSAEAQARPFAPYPDLLDQRLAARLALAEKVDRKQLSDDQAQRAFEQTMAHLLTEDRRRTASDLSGMRVTQRTCISDAAGNQTCRETDGPGVLQPPSATTRLAGLGPLVPSAPAVQHGAAQPVSLAAFGPVRVDINTASADDLNRLGGRFAKAIIRGRPYRSVDELLSKRVLTRSAFSQLKPQITANWPHSH